MRVSQELKNFIQASNIHAVRDLPSTALPVLMCQQVMEESEIYSSSKAKSASTVY